MLNEIIEQPVKKPVQQKLFVDERDLLQQAQKEQKKARVSRSGSTSRKAPKVFDCDTCGLFSQCNSPKMQAYGNGKKGILIVALCPGNTEDESGVPLVGPSGKLARRAFTSAGINLDQDCIRTNVVICRPKLNSWGKPDRPSDTEIKCCYSNLVATIQEVKPKLIICLGKEAIQGVLKTKDIGAFSALQMRGRVIPSLTYGCWVGCTVHPSYVLHKKNEELGSEAEEFLFYLDIAKCISYLDKPRIAPLSRDTGNELILDYIKAANLLYDFANHPVEPGFEVSFDYETSTLSPFDKDAEVISVALSSNWMEGFCVSLSGAFWKDNELEHVIQAFKAFLSSPVAKVVQSFSFEGLWSQKFYGVLPQNLVYDTIVGSHVINCVDGTWGLDFQVYELTGDEYKNMVDRSNLKNTPIKTVATYNSLDSRYTKLLANTQRKKLVGRLGEFNNLLVKALPTLSKMTYRGVRLDIDALVGFSKETKVDLESTIVKVRGLEAVSKFEKVSGKEFSPTNDHQIEKIIYDIYKHPCTVQTGSGRGCVDKNVLQDISDNTDCKELPIFIKLLQEFGNLESFAKVVNNYMEVADADGYVHPIFNLHIAKSFRSSANNPNIQNVPKRDSKLKKFRKCIITPDGYVIVELDYSGCEVRVIAMASGDKFLIKEIQDGIDTHRKWAAWLYEKNEKDITKEERFNAKNGFVFASFYGAKSENIARSMNLSPRHLRDVQRKFWLDYKDVKAWQEATIEFYKQNGYIEGMSGFRRPAPLSVNMILNTPIQGPAFHLNLDALTKIDAEIEKRDVESYLAWEVHDSDNFYMKPDEVEEVVTFSSDIHKSKRFEWQADVPLEVEWSSGSNWMDYNEKDNPDGMKSFDYKKFV